MFWGYLKVITSCIFVSLERVKNSWPPQLSFQTGHSVNAVFLRVQNDVLRITDNGGVLLVFLGLAGAFITADHDILLSLFEHYIGLTCTVLRNVRSITARIREWCSIKKSVGLLREVLQGLLPRSFEFYMYTFPLGAIRKYWNCSIVQMQMMPRYIACLILNC